MLSNKNNKMSPFKNMLLNPISGFRKTWSLDVRPLYSLIMIFGIILCALAATWQYQKSIFFLAPKADMVHMQGHYLNQHTHYLDNQTLAGKVGYAVITPFQYEKSVYLINRGFVAYVNRDSLPAVENINGVQILHGLLSVNNKPMLLNESLQDPIQKRIQYIDPRYFSKLLKKEPEAKILRLKEGAGLLLMQTEKEPYLSHHRHLAYALQWGLLALAGLCILLIASLKRTEQPTIKNNNKQGVQV